MYFDEVTIILTDLSTNFPLAFGCEWKLNSMGPGEVMLTAHIDKEVYLQRHYHFSTSVDVKVLAVELFTTVADICEEAFL